MQDRVSLYPGRVKLEPVAGQANLYDLTRADQPTQEGTPLNKASLLTDGVCEILGLDHNATPNDAFLAICLPSGKYAVSVTVKSPGGRPIPNVTLSGLLTAAGDPVVTGTDGVGLGFATTSPVTVTADISAFLDLTGTASVTVTPTAGVVNKAEITCTRASSAQTTISTSKTVRFSPDVSEYDFSAIGGGHNGGKASISHIPGKSTYGQVGIAYGGNGGDAGGVINQANVAVPSDLTLNVIVGAANGGKSSVNGIETGTGVTGGTGGHLAQYGSNPLEATPGLDQDISFLYPPTSVGGSGGGGKSCYQVDDVVRYVNESTAHIAAAGGSPGGGAGGSRGGDNNYGKPATKYGGGGGGAFAWGDHEYPQQSLRSDVPNSGGAGKQGVVGFMWRYKS